MNPYLSLVIPYHNDAASISRLLASIAKSKKAPPYEIIIVDDGSAVPYRGNNEENKGKLGSRAKKFSRSIAIKDRAINLTVVRLATNHGPAVARNRGVAKARGVFIVFLDGDVEVFSDTLANITSIYRQDPDVVALTGVWVKEQRSKAFFPNFKALRDWSYWINERDKSGYYFLFSTRIASIKRSVFSRLGGFNEIYPAPLVEDIELTYRIARRYAIIFAPNVRVRHEFESFWPIAKKYFLRAYYWTKLYQKRKKFDPVATTWWEALTTITAVATVGSGFFWLFSIFMLFMLNYELGITNYVFIQTNTFIILNSLFIIPIFVHLFLIHKFFLFMYREKGIVFAVKGFFVGLILYTFIFAGAIAGRIVK